MLVWIVLLIFLTCLGGLVGLYYALVEAPAARRRIRERLETVRPSTPRPEEGEQSILYSSAIRSASHWPRILTRLPGINDLRLYIRQAGLAVRIELLLLFSCLGALAALLVGTVLAGPFPGLLMAGVVPCLPFFYIAYRRRRRLARFEEIFPDAIDLLARAVRAGHAFTTGLDLISQEMPDPVATEFRITYEQQNLGVPLGDALRNLTRRVPLADVKIFVSALQLQRGSGGNLAEILDKISSVIRERFKILRQIKVYTAQGRMTLYFLTALPPITGVLLFLLNSEYMMRLFTDPLGHQALILAFTMQLLGYAVIRKIIQLKV